MTKKCQNCDNEIADKYTYCVSCNMKQTQANGQNEAVAALKEIAKQLRFINWNLGKISAFIWKDEELKDKIKEAEVKEVKDEHSS